VERKGEERRGRWLATMVPVAAPTELEMGTTQWLWQGPMGKGLGARTTILVRCLAGGQQRAVSQAEGGAGNAAARRAAKRLAVGQAERRAG